MVLLLLPFRALAVSACTTYRHTTHTHSQSYALRYIRSKLHVQGSVIQKFSTWNQTDDAMLTQSRLTEMVKELGVMDVTHAQVLAKEAFDSCRAVSPLVRVDVLDSWNFLE